MSDTMPLISVVDDDRSVCRAVGQLLQAAGYPVETFASAGEFLGSPALTRTACLVLDIHLNGVSGFDLQQRLTADRSGIPIIFITAHDDVPTRKMARRAGVVAYLPKPFDGRDLLAAIRGAVGGDTRRPVMPSPL